MGGETGAICEGDEQDGICNGDAHGHDGTHGGLNIDGGAGEEECQDHACDDCWHGGDDDEGETHGLKVRAEQKEDDDHGDDEAGAKAGVELLKGHDLSTQIDLGFPIGCWADFGDGGIDLFECGAEIHAVVVRSDADDAHHVVALVGADRCAWIDLGEIAQQYGATLIGTHGDVAEVFDGLGALLRNLNLKVVTDAVAGICPEICDGEATGGGGCHQ